VAQFVEVPLVRLNADTLRALLAEFASRDGTDYGEMEYTLEEKISQLKHQLETSQLCILYDADSEHWDILDHDAANTLLAE